MPKNLHKIDLKQMVISFVLIILCTTAFPQEPFHYELNDENGLPSNEVYQVIQDNEGYIWIGCDAGLFKYDGFEYKQFKSKQQNGRSISGLKLDAKGRIWGRNFNGQIYRVESDSLIVIADLSSTKMINSLYTLDKDCNVWFILENNLIQRNDQGKNKQSFSLKKPNVNIVGIEFYENKIFYSTRNGEIIAFIIDSNKEVKIVPNKIDSNNFKNTFYSINKKLFLISENLGTKQHTLFEIKNNQLKELKSFFSSDQNTRLLNMCGDINGDLWLCTANGTFKTNTTFRFLDEPDPILRNKKVSSVFQDKEGMYWISTLQDGIVVIPDYNIKKITSQNSNLTENNLTSLHLENDSTLLIGTYTGKINSYTGSKNNFSEIKYTNTKPILSAKNIKTYNKHIYIAHGTFSEITKGNISYSDKPYNARDFIIKDDTLFYLLPEINGKIYLPLLKSNPDSAYINTRNMGGRCMAYNPFEKAIYYVLNNGVFRYKKGSWTEIKKDGKSIFASSISINDNIIGVASISEGLILIKDASIVSVLNSSNSIIENELKLISISDNYIWTCSNNFLYRISKDYTKIEYFSNAIGINARDVNAISIGNKNVFLASNKGLIYFPENIKWENNSKPYLNIASILHNNKQITLTPIVALPHDNSNFQIILSSVALKSKGKYSYHYRMIGLDSTWKSIPASDNKITYQFIPPGEYTFEVYALNETGNTSDIRRIQLYVESPIWEKGWFYIAVTLLSIAFVALLFQYQLKKIRKRNEIEKKLIQSQLTALKAQMNPHFMYNALNSIQALILKQDIKNSNLYLGKFSHLMRKVLDISGKEEITINEEKNILDLYLSLEKLRFGTDFNYNIIIDNSIDEYAITLPPMVLQPFVENAIKHGLLHKKGEKELSIQFKLENELICIITDNGIGRKHANEIKARQSEKHQSFASGATEKRVELLNTMSQGNYRIEIIDIDNHTQTGTMVIVRIPLKK